jgi:hypothetical protein
MVVLGRRPQRVGVFLAAFLVLYMPVRFAFDFLRVADLRYGGLTAAQWVALAALAGVVPLLGYVRRQPRPGETRHATQHGAAFDPTLGGAPGQPADG